MTIPKKEEAVAVAQENVSIDAAKYERVIEAMLMIWDGKEELRLDVAGADSHLIPFLVAALIEAGYYARAVERVNAAKDWWIHFR